MGTNWKRIHGELYTNVKKNENLNVSILSHKNANTVESYRVKTFKRKKKRLKMGIIGMTKSTTTYIGWTGWVVNTVRYVWYLQIVANVKVRAHNANSVPDFIAKKVLPLCFNVANVLGFYRRPNSQVAVCVSDWLFLMARNRMCLNFCVGKIVSSLLVFSWQYEGHCRKKYQYWSDIITGVFQLRDFCLRSINLSKAIK